MILLPYIKYWAEGKKASNLPMADPYMSSCCVTGACAVAFYLFGSSFLFINSHLTPHEHRLNERIRDYSTIIKSLSLPKSLPPSFASNLILPGGDPESSVPLSEKAQGSPSAAGRFRRH